jgi:hypothetical protein
MVEAMPNDTLRCTEPFVRLKTGFVEVSISTGLNNHTVELWLVTSLEI